MDDCYPWIFLIGCDGAGLAPIARRRVGAALLVIGDAPALAAAAPEIQGDAMLWPETADDLLALLRARPGEPVALLTEGPPLPGPVATALRAAFPPNAVDCVPSLGQVEDACARAGWDAASVEVWGLPWAYPHHLHELTDRAGRFAALSAGRNAATLLVQSLTDAGFEDALIRIEGRGPGIRAADFPPAAPAGPALLLIEVADGETVPD
ncbi:hypothetical protein [Zavarzinia sp.]|uniref:hypothetical protein n=1 Tax=Zavarzinia sp. TaxID=2027920 RepID=UPI003569DD19